jgi:hypothetical protein
MKNLYLIQTGEITEKFKEIIDYSTKDYTPTLITSSGELPDLKGKKIIFAIELDQCGFNIPLFDILLKLKKRGDKSLLNSKAVIIVQSSSELFTKSIARKIILLCNQMGCAFSGHSVVEAIKNLDNYLTWQKNYNMPLFEIYKRKCKDLVYNLIKEKLVQINHPKILVLHSSFFKTSNTLMLWRMVKKNLEGEEIRELHVENGTVVDCRGCSYKTCIHYSEEKSCFYGGVMVKEILPAIEDADCIIWLCPNYNDAISAKLMAVINRMTVLYKRVDFHNKTIFSIIVSGNSGSDCVAKQLIGALNINKGFRLPPYFSLTAIANDSGAVKKIPGIKIEAKAFSNRIKKDINKSNEEK